MTREEFANQIKENPRLALAIIVRGNRPGVLRVLKAYQIKVEENATDDQLIETIIQGGKACELCLAEILLLRINTELLPAGYPEMLEELEMLEKTKVINTTNAKFGSDFDKTVYQGDTVTVNGILYTWNTTIGMYVMGSPDTSNNADQEDNATTDTEDPRLNWNNIISGGFGAVTAIFSSGVFGNNTLTTQTTTTNQSENNKAGNTTKILVALALLALAIGLIYYFKNRG